VTTLLIYGLLIFIFRLTSRREANKILSRAFISQKIREIFPEFDTIPHADTLALFLEKLEPIELEKVNIRLISELIQKKKFRKLLIQGHLPISIDATQKLVRDGLLNDPEWLERSFKNINQQYIIVVEANITFKNGLSIPLMTEYLCNEATVSLDGTDVQDCELEGAKRLIIRLKNIFKRLKIIIILDGLYPTKTIMQLLYEKKFQFLIKLPEKLKILMERLNEQSDFAIPIPGQFYFRERKQVFHWVNDVGYGDKNPFVINLVCCTDSWFEADKNTGDKVHIRSEHRWISSMKININNVHEICNLCARKRALIEDSMNTEKNRGYSYEKAFSYNWNGMRCFHYLMRIAHAINAISEFTKTLKKHIKSLGLSLTLKLIFEGLSNPWLSTKWMEKQLTYKPRLCLKLE
jgi:hypothetical protein